MSKALIYQLSSFYYTFRQILEYHNLIIPKINRLSRSSRVKHTVEELERFHIIFSNIL